MNIQKKALCYALTLMLALSMLITPAFANEDENMDAGSAAPVESIETGEEQGQQNPDAVSPSEASGNNDPQISQDDGNNQGDQDGNNEGQDNEDPSDKPAGEETAALEGWIPVLEKPGNADVECTEAVVCRRGGRDSDLEIFSDKATIAEAELTDEDLAKIQSGELELWNGYAYKKAYQSIKNADTDEDLPEELPLEFGSEAVSVKAKATNGEVKYSSADETVAAVDENGKVSPAGIGETNISITAEGNEYYEPAEEIIKVTVTKGTQTVTTGKDKYNVAFGSKPFSLGAKTNGDGELSFTSSDSSRVSVDSNGTVSIKDITSTPVTIKITASDTDHYKASETKTVEISVARPAAPRLRVAAAGKRKIRLTWSAVPGAVKYEVYCPQFAKKLRNGSTTRTYITSKKLKKGRRYKCRVRAVVTVGRKTYRSNWTSYVTSPKVR